MMSPGFGVYVRTVRSPSSSSGGARAGSWVHLAGAV
jgi:hypothetical protein